VLVLVAGMVAGGAMPVWAACDGNTSQAGAITIDVAGLKRYFVVRLPSTYDGRTAAPVVFAFHPFGMNAPYMQGRAPIGRAWPEAIAVYPEGSARDSNNITPSWQGRPGELGDKDLKFFDAMLAWLDTNACPDRARVFVLGYSNGAQFSNTLACERRSSLAGAAIAAGRLNCAPSAAAPLIWSHGLADRTASYSVAVEAIKTWATRNGCAAPPKAGTPGCFVGESCAAAPLTFCTHTGGHEYDLQFTRTAIDFFKSAAARGQ
jgi:polyhydroxybutyrate depolymerase